jgi:DNA-binding NarL/FixJ family response regulator
MSRIEREAGERERIPSALGCDDGAMQDRLYAIPAVERDRMILALRRRGWTLKRIGQRLGMSESGVKRALDRIRDGGFGEGMTRA